MGLATVGEAASGQAGNWDVVWLPYSGIQLNHGLATIDLVGLEGLVTPVGFVGVVGFMGLVGRMWIWCT